MSYFRERLRRFIGIGGHKLGDDGTPAGDAREAIRKQASESEQFRLLIQGVRDYAIFMLDPRGFVSTWNIGAERIKGYEASEIVGRHFSTFYTEKERQAGVPEAALAAAARDGRYEAEGWRVRKDGSHFWASVVVDAIKDDAGRLIGFAKVTRDITERLKTADALTRAQAAAAQAQKMEAIGHLTGGIAHDFNNLLTAIMGSLDLVQRRQDVDPEIRRHVTMAYHASERAAALTQRLLAFSRKQALAPRDVDVNRLVRNMSELLQRTLGPDIQVETVLSGGIWRVFVDANQLENALLNLAINARDAMPDGGKLTIETGNIYLDDEYAAAHAEVTAGQYALIAVSDTGSGMPPDVLEHAFEPFYTTKAEGRGTGLGLSQVYGFVKQSGGHVKIYSEPGQSTTVKIYLRRHFAEAKIEEAPPRPDTSILAAGEVVLVVDDDDAVREFTCTAMRSLGYRVLEASDGASALRLIEEQPGVRLLFTDVALPVMNGRRLAEAALERRPGLKVLYTTGYARNAIVHHGLLDAGVELLPKPFTVEAMGRKLRQILDR